ncbi:sel1 repeat family protein [Agrobacterium rubi]|nr:sel1 repeat family protein [Agrobacterium rubi]NTF24525.1 sel1 repeat family protein [Agrobacterium rubi]
MRKSIALVIALTTSSLLAGCSVGPTGTYPIFPAETTTRPGAFFDAGYVYENGLGVPRDYKKAIRNYEIAAKEKKDARALNNLGVMAVQGRGSPASVSKGLAYFKQATAGGSAAAHYNIGLIHDAGTGVGRSAAVAVAEYRMAAEMGHPEAQIRLSQMLASGDGGVANPAESRRLAEMAYARGVTASGGRIDPDKALASLAVEHCSTCISESDRGMAARQVTGLSELADGGDAVAQYNLGVQHLRGAGANLDPSEAARLFTLSARQGYSAAQRQLAQMHLRGQAVAKSKVLAHAWLNLAAKNDDAEGASARAEMDSLEVSMTAAEVREAQEVARSGNLKGR